MLYEAHRYMKLPGPVADKCRFVMKASSYDYVIVGTIYGCRSAGQGLVRITENV